MKDLPIYYCNIEDNTEGIDFISFVEFPAVDVNWFAFSKEKEKKLYFSDDEKHIVTSVALRADYPIYRNDNGREYYIVFTKENILKLVEKFFKDEKTKNVNLEHSIQVDGCYLIESYFAGEENIFGVSVGSWIVSYKVENEDVWNKIKSGQFNGFSIEGNMNVEKEDEIDEFLRKL